MLWPCKFVAIVVGVGVGWLEKIVVAVEGASHSHRVIKSREVSVGPVVVVLGVAAGVRRRSQRWLADGGSAVLLTDLSPVMWDHGGFLPGDAT